MAHTNHTRCGHGRDYTSRRACEMGAYDASRQANRDARTTNFDPATRRLQAIAKNAPAEMNGLQAMRWAREQVAAGLA